MVNDGAVNSSPDSVAIHVVVGVQGLQPPLAALVPEGDPVPLPQNAFKTGWTLPLKLQMFCGGTALTDALVAAPRIVGLLRNGDALDLATIDLDAGAESGSTQVHVVLDWTEELKRQVPAGKN